MAGAARASPRGPLLPQGSARLPDVLLRPQAPFLPQTDAATDLARRAMPLNRSALLAGLALWSPHLTAAAAAAAAPPTVIHLVADDLGYHDTNWKNHQVSTDALDALVKAGVEIPDFYVRLRAPYAPLPPPPTH